MLNLFDRKILSSSFFSFSFFSAIWFLPYIGWAQETADCAKVTSVKDTICPKLKVQFDLSACNDKAISAPIVKCEGTKATAVVQSEKYEYKVVLEEVESWGKKTYEMVGFINKEELKAVDAPESISQKVASPQPSAPSMPTLAVPIQSSVSIQAETPNSPASSRKTEASDDALVFSGLFDGYYSYNFDRPRSAIVPSAQATLNSDSTKQNTPATIPAGRNAYRAYDTLHNQFALNQVELSMKKTSGPIGFLLDLDFGKMADINHAITADNGATVTDEVTKHIGQAVISYLHSSGWTFSFGKMATHMGYEVIKAKDNWQYSRSFTYWYAIPVWHLGLSLSKTIRENSTISFYLYNGWNQVYDNNDGKTFGFQWKWNPNARTTMIYNLISGPETSKDNGSWRTVNEVNVTYQTAANLALAGEGLFGYEPTSVGDSNKWMGFSGHLKWDAMPSFYMSPRFEYFRDSSGSRLGTSSGQSQNILSGTFTVGFNMANGFVVKPEIRMDLCQNGEIFSDRNGETKKTQVTASVAALYSF